MGVWNRVPFSCSIFLLYQRPGCLFMTAPLDPLGLLLFSLLMRPGPPPSICSLLSFPKGMTVPATPDHSSITDSGFQASQESQRLCWLRHVSVRAYPILQQVPQICDLRSHPPQKKTKTKQKQRTVSPGRLRRSEVLLRD